MNLRFRRWPFGYWSATYSWKEDGALVNHHSVFGPVGRSNILPMVLWRFQQKKEWRRVR